MKRPMDKNKLKVLHDINYTIRPHCGICAFAKLSDDGWGVCVKHTYKHKKHNAETSYVSINKAGYCDYFDQNGIAAVMKLGTFIEFVEEP